MVKNKKHFSFGKLFIYLILILMYLPIFVLIFFSFSDVEVIGKLSEFDYNFSFTLYKNLFESEPLMEALGNTVLIAVVSAIVSTIIGTLGAIGTFYSSKRYRHTVETITQLPVVNAEIVMALSLAVVFSSLDLSYSFITLLIGHVVLTVAFVYLNVKPKLQQLDKNMYEAALDLGATPAQALFKVIIPEILPGIFSGFLISMTLSLDDFVITQYLKESSFETISTYIQKIVTKHPIPPEVRALTTLIFVVVLACVIGITIYNNKHENKKVGVQ